MRDFFNYISKRRNFFPPVMGVTGGIYVNENFVLQIAVRNFVASLTLKIKGSVLKKNGDLHPLSVDNFSPSTDGTESLRTLPLPEGLLLSCQVYIEGTSVLVREGDCYVALNLIPERSDISTVPIVATLAAGYITNSKGMSYPLSGVHDMTEGNGKATIITQANPAVATELSFTVPDHRRLRVNAVSFELTTDANAANRNVKLQIVENGGANGLFFITAFNVIASQVGFFTYSMRGQVESELTSAPNHFMNISFPQGLELHAGDQINTITSNKQAGDQFGRMRIYGSFWVDVGTSAGSPSSGGGAT